MIDGSIILQVMIRTVGRETRLALGRVDDGR